MVRHYSALLADDFGRLGAEVLGCLVQHVGPHRGEFRRARHSQSCRKIANNAARLREWRGAGDAAARKKRRQTVRRALAPLARDGLVLAHCSSTAATPARNTAHTAQRVPLAHGSSSSRGSAKWACAAQPV
jgi:hypothetical protein